MARKTPVIATRSGGPEEIIEDSVNGILIKPGDPIALAEKMEYLIEHPEAARTMGECGYLTVKNRFSEEVARERFVPLITRTTQMFSGYDDSTLTLSNLFSLFLTEHPQDGGSLPSKLEKPPMEQLECESPLGTPDSSVLMSHRLAYQLVPRRERWVGLDVLVGTHGRRPHGKLNLRVSSDNGYLLREELVDLDRVADNDWLVLRFAPIANARGKLFNVEFKLTNTKPQTRFSLYEINPTELKLRHLLRRAGLLTRGNSLHCRMCYAR